MDQKEYTKLSDSEKKKEDWMNSKWRPMMGWMYMGVCSFDFVLAPVLWSLLQSLSHGSVNTQWQPLTLQGAGLFHIAMGAVLGIAAHGRTQEKLNGANNGGISLPPNAGTTYQPPSNSPSPQTTGFSGGFAGAPSQTQGGFGGGGFGGAPSPAPQSGFGGGFGAQPIATTASGKKIVPTTPDPVL